MKGLIRKIVSFRPMKALARLAARITLFLTRL